ncbi:MAG: hypothetical protein RBR15_10055 [Sphaerochaeta sp.]|nr:hypothetical protein [Sphaerochaeta sp.]
MNIQKVEALTGESYKQDVFDGGLLALVEEMRCSSTLLSMISPMS